MIIFLYGEDSFRSRQKLKELKNSFNNKVDPSGNSLTVLNGQDVKIEKISARIGPRSLLSKKRMIIIEDIFLNKSNTIFDEIYNYLNKKTFDQDNNVIIFWDSGVKKKRVGRKENILIIDLRGREKPMAKKFLPLFNFLSTQKYTQEFKLLSSQELTAWVKKEVAGRGGSINYQALQTLISLVGNDLWQLNNELDKLINYKLGAMPKLTNNGQPVQIDLADIAKLVKGNFDENIFSLTDAISNKNKALAIKLLEEQYEAGLTDSYLINMIIRQFKILLGIRQALDLGLTSKKIMSSLKLHPFVVQKGINQVRNFNLATLKKILAQLIKIDFKMKTGQADTRTMLNLFFSKI